jgi:hypothetical protein
VSIAAEGHLIRGKAGAFAYHGRRGLRPQRTKAPATVMGWSWGLRTVHAVPGLNKHNENLPR